MREKNENVKIQVASVEDAEELLAIYAPYVEKTAITFEYEVPSVEEFKGRIAHVLQRFRPAAELGGCCTQDKIELHYGQSAICRLFFAG